ncbi:type II toxin-antitoxin system RelB/DinJ family antitoxin [Ligilactobacillus equi]|nr:type II toxin-antitoxin system RelB/DinJ family antitoxin [Ligilactobacillus equi]
MAALVKKMQVTIEKEKYDLVEEILTEVGMTPTAAVNVLFSKIISDGGLPFRPSLNERQFAKILNSKKK